MIVLVNSHISDAYNRTDFTFALKILSFVHKDVCRDLQTGPNMEKATCAFPHLASTSSSAPPVVVTILTRYVKTVTCSKAFPLYMISPAFAGARILISLDAFTFSPLYQLALGVPRTSAVHAWSLGSAKLGRPQVFKLLKHGKLYPGLDLTISLSCYPV